MRATPKSHFHNPVDALLGSASEVRVLRILARHGGTLSASHLVNQTRLTRSNVHKALQSLTAGRVVEALGTGRSVLYQIAPQHPLVPALTAIFEAEAGRVNRVFEAIHRAADGHAPFVLGAWLYGSVARGEDTIKSDLDVAIVVDEEPADRITKAIREDLEPMETDEGVTVSVLGLSPSEFLRLPSINLQFWTSLREDAVSLLGRSPDSLVTYLKIDANKTSVRSAETTRSGPISG